MRLRLIKITVLWFFSAGIIVYWLNAGKEGQVAREINNKISSIISDQLTDLHFFLDQFMHHNGTDLRQSFNPNYPTYGYRDGDLVFWNSNAYFPAYERIKTVDTVAFFSDENINVICLRVSKQEVSGALLAEMIRGCAIADKVDGIWACEFVENPLQPGFLKQKELSISAEAEISQIGMVIDNTTKTKAIFEINKGSNKNAAIDVNSNMKPEDRRIPMQNMIYIADGPSDIPSFSVVKKGGGKAYAVYNPESPGEFEQNDRLRQVGRIDHYGEADYRLTSATCKWLKLQIHAMCDRIVADREAAVASKVSKPPRHLSGDDDPRESKKAAPTQQQSSFLE